MLIYLRMKNELVLKKMKEVWHKRFDRVCCILLLISVIHQYLSREEEQRWFRVLKFSNFDPNPASFSCHQLHWEDWSKQINHLFYDCITVLQIPRSIRINFHLFINSFLLAILLDETELGAQQLLQPRTGGVSGHCRCLHCRYTCGMYPSLLPPFFYFLHWIH